MQKVDVYFVRHGETDGNIAHRHQQEDTHLTKLGREQAEAAAKKIAEIKPTHFYVSQRVRALETGQKIAAATDMVPESDPLFIELVRPDKMYGHFHRSVKTVVYLWRWWRGKIGGSGHYGEGESYNAFLERLDRAKAKLSAHPSGSRVVVVSHTVFINMFLAHMDNKNPLSLMRAFGVYLKIKRLPNGSITHLRFDKDTEEWELMRK